ncbi:UNVERIFIED_CONTAM: hypothetical protein RMT77_007505 [Armadillidium vulgare]
MSKNNEPDSIERKDIPEYTLRKKYTKRPSHVMKMKLIKPSKDLKLPEDDTRRMWSIVDEIHVVIKTWQYEPLPSVNDIFKDSEFESISVEFNLGPHEYDVKTLRDLTLLNCEQFSLEFREHWAGAYPKVFEESNEPKDGEIITKFQPNQSISNCKDEISNTNSNDISNTNTNEISNSNSDELSNSYSDIFLKPFLEKENLRVKLRVLTGRISPLIIKELPFLYNLKFLGLRLNYTEYESFVEAVPYFQSLERIHIFPQWKFKADQEVPPIKFLGIVTIYYWDLETTKSVKKSYQKWKKNLGKKKFLCF